MSTHKKYVPAKPEWNDPDFWSDAQCLGRPQEFMTHTLPTTRSERHIAARRLCRGCPMVTDCAEWALSEWGTMNGLVVGGEPVPVNSGHETSRVKRRLELVAQGLPTPTIFSKDTRAERSTQRRGKTFTDDPTKLACRRCKAALRPHRAKAEDFPDTLPEESRSLCKSCYQKSTRDGTVRFYPRRTVKKKDA